MAGAVVLYATTGSFSSNLYTIDTTTHAVTLTGNTGLNGVAGIDFDSSR
jgi:DNA-binding beta-propeller fold protein YncE